MSNYCTKCQSYYSQPGTCNCYAGAAPLDPYRAPLPWEYQPWQPTLPYIGDRPWLDWPGGTWVSETNDFVMFNGTMQTQA